MWLHLARPTVERVEGWRERPLATRTGDLLVRRGLYRDAAGRPVFLLDAHLGWTPRQVATPSLMALLLDWAADVPFAAAAGKLAGATAGVLSGPTVRRQLQRVAARVGQAEVATHQTWTATGQVPQPAGERVVAPLYVEADGVWGKTQSEPAHPTGYERKCASAYEGWQELAGPTRGHPRPHQRLVERQLYCHAHARETLPFWEGASLALHRTYDLSRLPLVVVGGDGAQWIDGAAAVFPRVVRQRDGFHLAREAAGGWGPERGAKLYAAIRAGDQPTALELLGLPAPQESHAAKALSPVVVRPALPVPVGAGSTATDATDTSGASSRTALPALVAQSSSAASGASGALVPKPSGAGMYGHAGTGRHP